MHLTERINYRITSIAYRPFRTNLESIQQSLNYYNKENRYYMPWRASLLYKVTPASYTNIYHYNDISNILNSPVTVSELFKRLNASNNSPLSLLRIA